MIEWHINNQSTKPFLIQQAEKQLSIVKPLPNGSFQILTEINLENGNISNIDHSLLVSVDPKALEISIFDAVN
ncbi:TPA: hypothetical protein SH492_001725 [Staphylococcus aureus]|nr:hypothetical protein [Staphylococcus aureus]